MVILEVSSVFAVIKQHQIRSSLIYKANVVLELIRVGSYPTRQLMTAVSDHSDKSEAWCVLLPSRCQDSAINHL